MDTSYHLIEILDFASAYASQMLGSGTHTSRVMRCTSRVVESLGMHVEISTTLRHFTICVKDNYDRSLTRVISVPDLPVSFERNADLSSLSWQIYDECLTLEEAKQRFDELVKKKSRSDIIVLTLVSLANACFCRLFDGDFVAMAVVLVATFIGFSLRLYLMKRGINHYIVFVMCAFVASICASVALALDCTAQTAIATSPLFLIPGVPLINGVIDIMDGHILVGISRLMSATLLILCIAIGLSITLLIIKSQLLCVW